MYLDNPGFSGPIRALTGEVDLDKAWNIPVALHGNPRFVGQMFLEQWWSVARHTRCEGLTA
ncbi:hypothetical protein SAE02_74250 [Skermanella aerolata]|uniref:Uncharacterized protein n=1 Tax=Skermanella aerolata TaxID=393310 RepID=A0A512E3L1_9PROT|nr:hypothetical protein N826_31175 [Skermanella aerolata KACC 11604]GEO43277.1 hypothetical protein SAE02_74250 [Skermanella aerolata]